MTDFSVKSSADYIFKDTSDFVYAGNAALDYLVQTVLTSNNSVGQRGIRIRIDPISTTGSANFVVLYFSPWQGNGASIGECWIGRCQPGTFAFVSGSQVQVTFNNNGAASTGQDIVSDPIQFDFNDNDYILVSFNSATGFLSVSNFIAPYGSSKSYNVYTPQQADPSSDYPATGYEYNGAIFFTKIAAMHWDGSGDMWSISSMAGVGGYYDKITATGLLSEPSKIDAGGEFRPAVSGDGIIGRPSAFLSVGWAEIFGNGDMLSQSKIISESREYVFFYNY